MSASPATHSSPTSNDQTISIFALQDLTLHPVLTSEADLASFKARFGDDFPCHKYDSIVVQGFRGVMSSGELNNHPLVRLLHDYRHLMLHGDRGDRNTRDEKRIDREPFENGFCRLGITYDLFQDPKTYNLTIRVHINTGFQAIWINPDGSKKRDMTNDDISRVTTNLIESYLTEAELMIRNKTVSCHIDSIVNIIGAVDSSKTATPPQEKI